MRSILCFVGLLSALVLPSVALANGRFPAAQHVMVGPGPNSQTIALRTTFGFAVSDDGGASFHWLCEQALGYAGGVFDPPFVVNGSSQLQLGLFDGLSTIAPDRCGRARDAALEHLFVADLDVTEAGDLVVAVSSSGSTGAFNQVFRSMSGGPFQPLGTGAQGVLFATLEMARSNTQRIYLTGVTTSGVRSTFYRSDDGGVTLDELPFDPGFPVRGAYVAGIDPTNQDVVYVRAVLDEASDAEPARSPTSLLRSDDAGMHFHEVARTADAMLGFAISDDGATVWYGGSSALDGLYRSTDRGLNFTKIGMQQVQCLRQHGGSLYLCANFVLDHFALGRSTDLGDHFTPLLQFTDLLAPVTCPAVDATTPAAQVCGPLWPAVRAQFVTPMDAGTADAGPMVTDGNCHCGVAGALNAHASAFFATIATFIALGARRRRKFAVG